MKNIMMGKVGYTFFGLALLVLPCIYGTQGIIASKTGDIVSIDTLSIMQKSQEGKKIAAQIQKDVEAFQSEVKKAQEDLTKLQEDLSKKAKVLNQEALQEKTEELTQKKKEMEQKLSGKEESLRMGIQRKQITLREKQLSVANDVFEKEGWALMIDKQTPGLLGVAKALDKTETVLKAVDTKYAQVSVKSTTVPAVNTVEKKTIKTA